MNKYGFNVAWSDEDQGFIATCPEFPGLSAFGRTREEALAEAQNALGLFLKTYEEDGLPLPEPQTIKEYSGQFRVRLPKSLHQKLARQADREEVSLNSLVTSYLAEMVGVKTEARRQEEKKGASREYVREAPAHHLIIQRQHTTTTTTAFSGEQLSEIERLTGQLSPSDKANWH